MTPNYPATPTTLPSNPALEYSRTPVKTGNSLYDSIPSPGYHAAYDPKAMSMADYLSSVYGDNSQGYDAFKQEALRSGPSRWLNMSLLQGDLKERTQRENAGREANAATMGSLDKLASTGGLSTGARERAVEAGAKNYLGMSQGLQREGNINDIGLRIQDEGNRMGMLSALPGMEQTRVNTWQTARTNDVQNQLEEANRLNQYNKDLYTARLEAAAAERQANATENSGKK